MSPQSPTALFARFAGASLLVAGALVAVFAFGRAREIRSAQEELASGLARVSYAVPVARVFDDTAGDPGAAARLTSQANLLVLSVQTPELYAVKVWGAGDGPIYHAGSAVDSSRPSISGESTSHGWTSAGGRQLFVTRAAFGDQVVEVFQDGSRLDDAIGSAQRTMLLQTGAFALAGWLLVAAVFWLTVRALVSAHRRLAWLHRRGDELRSTLDVHDVVTSVAKDATTLASGHYGIVTLFEEESQELILQASYDRKADVVAHHHRPVEEWFLRRCIATNSVLTGTTTGAAWRDLYGLDNELAEQLALLCVPLSLRDGAVGVIALVRPMQGRRGFTAFEVRQVEELASQAVTAVEQAHLFAKVRSYANEIELNYDATLKALMAALDTKDEVTEGHCERVAKLTVHLAREMGVAESQMVDIERGALLHDVGKIGVPDEILKKPDSLNEREWEAMRKHPLLAGVLVSKVGFLEGALPILMYHHERFDGAGYPFGLIADKIPIEARIFSVIDAYDAMTSNRPYRKAMSHDDAMVEIAAHRWTQFDPHVVDAFERMMDARPELQHHGSHLLSAEHGEHDDYLPDDGDDGARDVA